MIPVVGVQSKMTFYLTDRETSPYLERVSPCVIQITGNLVLRSMAANRIGSYGLPHTRGAFRDYRPDEHSICAYKWWVRAS